MDCSPSGSSVPGIYWSGLTLPPPGDFHDPWIKPRSPALQADCLLSELPGRPITSINIFLKKKKTGFYLIAFSHLLICSRLYILPLSLAFYLLLYWFACFDETRCTQEAHVAKDWKQPPSNSWRTEASVQQHVRNSILPKIMWMARKWNFLEVISDYYSPSQQPMRDQETENSAKACS